MSQHPQKTFGLEKTRNIPVLLLCFGKLVFVASVPIFQFFFALLLQFSNLGLFISVFLFESSFVLFAPLFNRFWLFGW